MLTKIFISSNQKEFAEERRMIKEEIENDFFLGNLFEVFLFEDSPATGETAYNLYMNNIEETDIYIGLIGSDYGNILHSGKSPTEEEYDRYNKIGDESYVFIKNTNIRDEKTLEFIRKVENSNVYKLFNSYDDLIIEIKRSLLNYVRKFLKQIPYDERIISATSIDDVDMNALETFYSLLNQDSSLLKVKNVRSTEEILEYIGAGKIDKTGFHLNNTGLLFFGKDVSKYDVSHQLKMVKFNNIDRIGIIDKKETKSSIFNLFNEIESFFNENTKHGLVIDGFKSVEVPEYPYEVIREAIVNAIAHRDYDFDNSFITFYIYTDRIEIISPGRLPYPLTIDQLGKTKNPIHRNPRITEILSKTKYMEHDGTGISMMRKTMKEHGLPEPEFSDENNFFKVILYGPNNNLITPDTNKRQRTTNKNLSHLNDRQKEFLEKYDINKPITYNEYMELFKVSKSTARRDMNLLIEYNFVHKEKKDNQPIFYII